MTLDLSIKWKNWIKLLVLKVGVKSVSVWSSLIVSISDLHPNINESKLFRDEREVKAEDSHLTNDTFLFSQFYRCFLLINLIELMTKLDPTRYNCLVVWNWFTLCIYF